MVFLMLTFFIKDSSSATQYNTLRFLTSLCSGFAGAFFTGEALFRLDQTLPAGGKIAVSGTAGCALFFVLWFTYPKRTESSPGAGVQAKKITAKRNANITDKLGGTIIAEQIKAGQDATISRETPPKQ